MGIRISPSWINEYLLSDASCDELARQLNATGFETEIYQDVEIDPSIIIGEIVRCEQHPQADKLKVCTVNTGRDKLQIVCGCPSVVHAKYVVVAPIGSRLPHMTLKPVELRGVQSEGMLCSLKELGLSEDGTGIYHVCEPVKVGVSFIEHARHESKLLDIDITPNRGDCLSVYGIARDLAATMNLEVPSYPDVNDILLNEQHLVEVKTDAVLSYHAMTLTVDPSSRAPIYMINRLRQAGMGSNHPVVDILNYIMLEIGQPMHGFDQNVIQAPLVVQQKADQEFKLLDDSVYTSLEHDIVISDDNGTHALAGVMGGYESRMREESTHVQLESAVFKPSVIAKTLRKCRLSSEASYRYERGVAKPLSRIALHYAASLMIKYLKATPANIQYYEQSETNTVISFDAKKINRRLGTNIDDREMLSMLSRLGFDCSQQSVTVPWHRYDIQILEDLSEEVARLYGYDQIPLEPLVSKLTPRLNGISRNQKLRNGLKMLGYHEVVQFSFVSKEMLELLPNPHLAIELANPIHAEFGFMRTELLQSLLMAADYNTKRQKSDFKLFEIGRVYHQDDDRIDEPLCLSGILAGQYAQGYLNGKDDADYYHIQSDLQRLMHSIGVSDLSFQTSQYHALHPKQSADVYINERCIGFIGRLHPKVVSALGLPESLVFSLQIDSLPEATNQTICLPSKYPSIKRDITITINKNQSIGEIIERVHSLSIQILSDARLLDVYDLNESEHNVTIGLVFQSSEETLSDKEIDRSISEIQAAITS